MKSNKSWWMASPQRNKAEIQKRDSENTVKIDRVSPIRSLGGSTREGTNESIFGADKVQGISPAVSHSKHYYHV